MRPIQSSRQNKGIHFEKAVILDIVRQRENGASTRMLCQEYKMSGATLAMWLLKYGSSNYKSGLRVMHKPQQISPLEAARLKIKTLETMIEVAEEQFKISIRKKFGAKQ